jgi:hypothetical protein
MSITNEEWEEYSEYLDSLTDEEFNIEMDWLKTIGKAKQRGSFMTINENFTLQ